MCSLTASGLQSLVDLSVTYIENHGLRFNPEKSNCIIYGKCSLNSTPNWSINGQSVKIASSVTYLGTDLDGTFSGNHHTQHRIRAGQKAFYALQGAGLKFQGLSPQTSMQIYNAAVRSTLIYGCSSIQLNKSNIKKLDTLQGQFIKNVLGINSSQCRTSPLLCAFGILPVSHTINIQCLDLLRSCLLTESSAHDFYSFILNNAENTQYIKKTVVGRVLSFTQSENIELLKYCFMDPYRNQTKRTLLSKSYTKDNGLVDSVKYLLYKYNNQNKHLLNILLKAF